MVKFRFGRRVTPSAETPRVDERLAEAAKEAVSPAAGAVVGETDVSRPGVSDAAGDRVAPADLADAAERLGTAEGSTSSGGGGSDGGGAVGSSGSTVGSIEEARAGLAASDPTGLTSVADQLAARRPVADLSQGPEQQDPFDAIAEAKAGLPGSALREGSNSLLSDAASRDDGVTGIAEQGSGAAGYEDFRVHGGGRYSWLSRSDKYGDTLIEIEDSLGGGDYRRAYDATTGAVLSEQRGIFNRFKGTFAPITTTTVDPTTGNVRIRDHRDDSIIVKDKQGNVIEQHPPTGEYELIDEPVGIPAKRFVGTPDEESIGDEFRHISEGLEERLGPRGGGGDGHTDPVDDGGVSGPITESAVPDVQEALLGGDPRLGGVVDGAGTSGFRAGLDGLDLSRGAGTIRNPDEEFLGGGLEDDPLDQLGRPGASLDSAPLTDTAPPSDETAGSADGDFDPLDAIGSLDRVAPIGRLPGAIDPSVFGRIPPVPVADVPTLLDIQDAAAGTPFEQIPPDTGSGPSDAGSAEEEIPEENAVLAEGGFFQVGDTGDADPAEADTSSGSSGLVDPIGLFAGGAPIDRSVFGIDRPLLGGFESASESSSDDSATAEDDSPEEP